MKTIELQNYTLSEGAHDSIDDGSCLMELASFVAGEPWSDHPKCVSPVIGAYGRRLNDGLPDGERQKLIPFIPGMLGTAGDGLVRVAVPRWLDLAGMTAEAGRLRGLAPVVDSATASAARRALAPVRARAWAVRRKAREGLTARIRQELEKRGLPAAAASADAAAAAAAAADAAAGSSRYWAIRNAVYTKMYALYLDRSKESRYAEVVRVNNEEAIVLLGRIVNAGKVAA